MCDKAANTSTIKFVPECHMTEEICDEAVNTCFFLYLIIFLIDIELNKCVIELFLKILFDSILP